MATIEDVSAVFLHLPGHWAVTRATTASALAARHDDGLQLMVHFSSSEFIQVSPVLPRTPVRSASPEDWADITQGNMPSPAKLSLARGPEHAAAILERGLLLEAEALHAVTQEVARLEEEPRKEAKAIAEALGTYAFARKVTDLDDPTGAVYRLRAPFPGEFTIRPDGTAKLELHSLPLEVARALVYALADIAANVPSSPQPLPRYEPPERASRSGRRM